MLLVFFCFTGLFVLNFLFVVIFVHFLVFLFVLNCVYSEVLAKSRGTVCKPKL